MTINNTANKVIAAGNGVMTVFNFAFVGVEASDISVLYTDTSGNETTLTPSQYTLVLNATPPGQIWGLGGTVTYPLTGSPIALNTTLTIVRTVPLLQEVSLGNQGNEFPSAVEAGLDLLEMQIQQVNETFQRAIVAPIVDSPSINLIMPPAAQRANTGLAFDNLGNVIAGTTPATGLISTAMQPVVDAASILLGQQAFGLTSIPILCTESFAANVYTLNAIAPNTNPPAYANGQRFTFTATAASSAAASAIVGALAQLGIYKSYGLQANILDLILGWSYTLEYSAVVDAGAPGFLLLDTPPPNQALQPFFNVVIYGATGNGATDDTAAIQACINAAQAVGGIVFFPGGTYKISAALNIIAHVAILGCGFQTDPINYGFGSTASGVDARSTGFKASVIVCGVANSAFAISTTDSVSVQGIQITYPTAGNSGVAAFLLNTASGNVGVNLNSIIRDVLINNANIAIKVTDWVQFHFDNIYFVICTQCIVAENLTSVNTHGVTTSADCGDSVIANCTFLFTQGNQAILLESGSGYRITNNKFNGSNGSLPSAAAIEVSPQNLGFAFTMTPGIIANNSMEGFGVGILFTPNAASLGQLSLWTIVGNEFFCTNGIVMSSGTAIPQWLAGIVISGNTFTFGQNGSSSACIILAGVSGCLVGDNLFGGTAVQPGVSIGAYTSILKIGNNSYQNAQPPGGIGPALPGTGVGSTNNTGYVASVNIFGGTVSSVTIAPAGGFGFSAVATASNCTVTLSPGDQIIVNYSVAPTWIWRALNP